MHAGKCPSDLTAVVNFPLALFSQSMRTLYRNSGEEFENIESGDILFGEDILIPPPPLGVGTSLGESCVSVI